MLISWPPFLREFYPISISRALLNSITFIELKSLYKPTVKIKQGLVFLSLHQQLCHLPILKLAESTSLNTISKAYRRTYFRSSSFSQSISLSLSLYKQHRPLLTV
ncbi:hypothetical protein QVD99_004945 [Batrachochytrium dendrobatidis]|nr:hypothetical protein QVD99_004945 [Batrachochytrium dendrobatidis]